MERLTYFKDGYWRVNFSGVQYQADFVDRLAAYEDTGLTPEEIKASTDPFVHQFVFGEADGPVHFHYPAVPFVQELMREVAGA